MNDSTGVLGLRMRDCKVHDVVRLSVEESESVKSA